MNKTIEERIEREKIEMREKEEKSQPGSSECFNWNVGGMDHLEKVEQNVCSVFWWWVFRSISCQTEEKKQQPVPSNPGRKNQAEKKKESVSRQIRDSSETALEKAEDLHQIYEPSKSKQRNSRKIKFMF